MLWLPLSYDHICTMIDQLEHREADISGNQKSVEEGERPTADSVSSTTHHWTVFICFGAILGTILLSYLGFLVWRSYTSKKDTAENYNDANTGYYGSDPGEATGSSSRLPLLKPKNSSLSQFSMIRPNSPQPMQQMKQNDVTRLQFVSPTFEAMNMSKQNENRPQISEPTMLSTSNLSVSNATHNRNSSYLSMPLHQRDSSYMPALGSTSEISLAAPRKSTAPATRQTRTGHRTVPSMYLESMFDDSRDD